MRITIREEEYDAIHFAINQIEGEIESASDEVYISDAGIAVDKLYAIINRYKEARNKSVELADIKKLVRSQYPDLNTSKVEKLARKVLRKRKEE